MSVLGDLAFLAQNNHTRDQMSQISSLRNTKKASVRQMAGDEVRSWLQAQRWPDGVSVLLEPVSRILSVKTGLEQMFREKR